MTVFVDHKIEYMSLEDDAELLKQWHILCV